MKGCVTCIELLAVWNRGASCAGHHGRIFAHIAREVLHALLRLTERSNRRSTQCLAHRVGRPHSHSRAIISDHT
eukprot:10968289-Alexandrium_andersonii.AAC.1